MEGAKLLREGLAVSAPLERGFFLQPREKADEEAWEAARVAGLETWEATRGVFFRLLWAWLRDLHACPHDGKDSPRAVGGIAGRRGRAALRAGGGADSGSSQCGRAHPHRRRLGPEANRLHGGLGRPFSSRQRPVNHGFHFARAGDGRSRYQRTAQGLRERGVRLLGTSAGASTRCWNASLRPPCALLLGNESEGLSEEAKVACDELITIPMYGGAHSFNVTVAAGILLYEAARQRAAGA